MRKTVIYVTLFNFLAAGITFIINALLARVFPYEDFGRISVLMSLNVILISLLQFGFSNAIVVFYNKNKENDLDRGLFNYFTKKYLLFLLFLIPVYFTGIFLLDRYYNLTFYEKMFLFSATFITTVYNNFTSYYQAIGNWKKYNFVNIFPNILRGGILGLGFSIIYFLFNRNINYELYLKLYILYAIILFLFGILLFNDMIGIKNRSGINDKDFNKLVLSFGLVNIVIAITMRVDNLIIEKYLGAKEVAIYSAANSLALVFPIITGSIMRVFMKEISKDSNYYLNKILAFQKKYIIYLIGIIVGVVLISPYLIPLIFGSRYEESVSIFQLLVITYISSIYFTPIESYFYNEKSALILLMKCLQLVIFLIVSIILINVLSLYAVALAVLVSRLFAWFYFYLKALKIKQNVEMDIK